MGKKHTAASFIRRARRKAVRIVNSGAAATPRTSPSDEEQTSSEKFHTMEIDGWRADVFDRHIRIRGPVDKKLTEARIPHALQGKPVTTIARRAFASCAALKSVSIPDSVTTIGAEAFADCVQLTSVELPSDLTVINAGTFSNCKRLRTVTLPYELERIARRAFAGCTALVETPHFVKTGISTVMTVDRSLIEPALPTKLRHVGDEAFRDCLSLTSVTIPYLVTRIGNSAFAGCSGLQTVWLHAKLKEIGSHAFAQCTNLQRIRIPSATTKIGSTAFDPATLMVCTPGSVAHHYAREHGLALETANHTPDKVVSAFGAEGDVTVHDVVDSPDLMQTLTDQYELRPPVQEVQRDATDPNSGDVRPSRFSFIDGVYHSTARRPDDDEVSIMMVGDLMARFRQQASALLDGVYDFSASLAPVSDILESSDLAIGNLESMVAESYPYMHERMYVDDRPHLNAPSAFLTAVRQAGFDVVMNAQNHMYDVGIRGIVETLDALNRAQLIHSGIQVSPNVPRHIVIGIKGMRIGLITYLDGARQRMKQTSFTPEGLAIVANHFDDQRIRADIDAARADGAEFIIAYGHWGREYTDEITARQQRFAQMVADAGADYIFGSHSHCPQPYTILLSDDGRRVPVVYSGGNFLSDIGLKKPITQDTFIASLTLGRVDGNIVVKADGFVPCRIITSPKIRGFAKVVPTDRLEAGYGEYDPLTAASDRARLAEVLGSQYRELSVDDVIARNAADQSSDRTGVTPTDIDGLVARYGTREPRLVVQQPQSLEAKRPPFEHDSSSGVWSRASDTARDEAIIMAAGSLVYSPEFESRARAGEAFQFRSALSRLASVIEAGDLAVASLGTLVAEMYPSVTTMTNSIAGRHYSNARLEYLDAVRSAGFDCLALANPYNLDAGVRGALATAQAVTDADMTPSGLGSAKSPTFDVNGIRISVLSYTLDLYRRREMITGEGAHQLLNAFDEARARADIDAARDAGTEFTLAYLDCRSATSDHRLAERLDAARRLAECGADYVICSLPAALTRYETHRTTDGRSVPIATSLGTLAGSASPGNNDVSAVLKIVVRRTAAGSIEVVDRAIPVRRIDHGGGVLPVTAPTLSHYYPAAAGDRFLQSRLKAVERLGDLLPIDDAREVRLRAPFEQNLSPADASRILGVPFAPAALKSLGSTVDEKATVIASRRKDLQPGCIAVMGTFTGSTAQSDTMSIQDVIDAQATMIVAEEPHNEVPTLVVPNAWTARTSLIQAIRARYSPLVVGITGTVGKTTTKDLLGEVFDRHYRTLRVSGNNNSTLTVPMVVQKLTASDEAYIQEVHEGTAHSARIISELIRPRIAVITSLGEGHLDQLGSVQAVVRETMKITAGMPGDGILILNNGSEHLRAQRPTMTTLRYGVEDDDADYIARDVRASDARIDFRIESPGGSFEVVLHLGGVHNVENALGAFAAADQAGVPPHKILAGLSRYRPSTVRQNVINVGGYSILLDAYNSNVLSLTAALETLSALPVAPNGRRIVVMGDMGEQGDRVQENHELIGSRIGALPIDKLLAIGEGSRHTVRVAQRTGLVASHYSRVEDLLPAIRNEIRPGDTVLFKAAGSVKLAETVVYPLFGRIG